MGIPWFEIMISSPRSTRERSSGRLILAWSMVSMILGSGVYYCSVASVDGRKRYALGF